MAGQPDSHGDADARERLAESVRAWWTSVLAGQVEGSHPVQGPNLKAEIDGETLVVSGTVPTEADRLQILTEANRLKGEGIGVVCDKLEVAPEAATGEPGLLSQTLVGIFENAELAGVALTFLKTHVNLGDDEACIIGPENADAARAQAKAQLPEAFWDEAEQAIADAHALLILHVDETEAFSARELLDEDTRTIQTLVLPPEAGATSAGEPRPGKPARREEA